MLSSHDALPREGHLEAVFRIFSYLKTKTDARLVLDPMYAPIDYDAFQKQNWDTFYWDPVEHLPTNAGDPLLRRRGPCRGQGDKEVLYRYHHIPKLGADHLVQQEAKYRGN